MLSDADSDLYHSRSCCSDAPALGILREQSHQARSYHFAVGLHAAEGHETRPSDRHFPAIEWPSRLPACRLPGMEATPDVARSTMRCDSCQGSPAACNHGMWRKDKHGGSGDKNAHRRCLRRACATSAAGPAPPASASPAEASGWRGSSMPEESLGLRTPRGSLGTGGGRSPGPGALSECVATASIGTCAPPSTLSRSCTRSCSGLPDCLLPADRRCRRGAGSGGAASRSAPRSGLLPAEELARRPLSLRSASA